VAISILALKELLMSLADFFFASSPRWAMPCTHSLMSGVAPATPAGEKISLRCVAALRRQL
jgi:hypothetical protein